MQEKNNNNLFIIILTSLFFFIILVFGTISSNALSFEYNLNDDVFKTFRANNPGYVMWEEESSGRLYLMGGNGLRRATGNIYKPTLDRYSFCYTKDGLTLNYIGMPPELTINNSNIKIIDASEPLNLDNGTVFFYRPLTGQLGDVIQTQAFQNVKVIAVTACLVLSLMVSLILLKRLLIFL